MPKLAERGPHPTAAVREEKELPTPGRCSARSARAARPSQIAGCAPLREGPTYAVVSTEQACGVLDEVGFELREQPEP